MRLHLLDGTYELFRSYFGAPSRRAADGREVGAIHGLITSTLALLQEPGVTHLAAAFDTEIRSFRNDLLSGYKTGEGIEEDLLAQFPLAERALIALGIVVWPMVEYEADDALASATARWRDQVDQVVILSPDKDLSQCVTGDRVVTYDRRRAAFRDEQGVWDKFGVGPSSIPDYLALVGDAADGLPGLAGWGAKSTATVLAHYRHIERIPLDPKLWEIPVRGAVRLAASLQAGLGDALLYRYLALLRREVPLREELQDLEWTGAHRQPFERLCDELGFSGLRKRPHRWAAV
jgi:5'-3' exonuclease